MIEGQVLFVRSGKLVGNLAYSFDDNEFPDEEVCAEFLSQFYQGTRFTPNEILLPVVLEDADVRAELLTERKGKRVALLCPQRGDKLRLVEMAQENARHSFIEKRRGKEHKEKTLDSLRRALQLQNAPKRIECFDISNTQGDLAVGSLVVFDECEPDKKRYRRFRIKTVEGADDYGMMYEVLTRRYRRALGRARPARPAHGGWWQGPTRRRGRGVARAGDYRSRCHWLSQDAHRTRPVCGRSQPLIRTCLSARS